MRKIALLLAVLLLLTAATALAEDQAPLRRIINYPGQDIAIAIPAQYVSFYKEHIGLTVILRDRDPSSYVRVRVLPYDPAFDEADYLENTWLPDLRKTYMSPRFDYLQDEGETQTYTVAGRKMIGRIYKVNLTVPSTGWVLLDRWNGQAVCYTAYFPNSDPDDALLLLSNVVRSVNKSSLAPGAAKQSLSRVDCPEQRFSFSAEARYPHKYAAGEGVTVYTQKQGVIPYIMVYQSEDLIVEAFEYLKEQYSPHMEERYGKDLTYHYEYQDFLIGGKSLPAGWYEYKVQGREVRMLRVVDSTGSRTVVYTAKFMFGEGEATMLALDAAIRSFQSTAQPIR